MKIHRLSHHENRGWSHAFPAVDSDRTLVLAFAAPRYGRDTAALGELRRAFPTSHHLGCSTSGEIHGATVVDDSISVAIVQFERSWLRPACAHVGAADESYAAGRDIGRQLAAEPELKGAFVLSDGLAVNGSQLVRGLNDVLPPDVVITGGLAGDGDRFRETWTLLDGLPRAGVVAAIGFYGPSVRLGHGSQGGWDLFGVERRVTRSRGNVLYEIDGKPALQLYKEYLGDRASALPASALLFPLALRSDERDQKTIVRTILAVDETEQSMLFAGDIPQGSLVQLMRANFDRLIQGAGRAARNTGASDEGADPILSIAVSCVGRRLVLGERAEDECEATMDALPPRTEQLGFYSYGEISPWATGSCDLHNQTMTLTTISET